MSLNTRLIEGVSKSGLTDDVLTSMMLNDLEVTKENNRSAEAINAQDNQDKTDERYHWQCIVAFIGGFIICGGLIVLSIVKQDLDIKDVIPTISTLLGMVFGFVAGKKK